MMSAEKFAIKSSTIDCNKTISIDLCKFYVHPRMAIILHGDGLCTGHHNHSHAHGHRMGTNIIITIEMMRHVAIIIKHIH